MNIMDNNVICYMNFIMSDSVMGSQQIKTKWLDIAFVFLDDLSQSWI